MTTRILVAIALGFALASTAANADSNTVLQGHVYLADSGAPGAAAIVTATSPSESRAVTADRSGHFVFFGLQADRYTVSTSYSDYDYAVTFRVDVTPDETGYVVFPLQRDMHNSLDALSHGYFVGGPSYVVF